jgi:trans-2,3-dihydro-3-hydroxyanthranilate isomerase
VNVALVRACRRSGTGGSPTAVVPDGPLSDEERRAVPAAAGTSHAVFVSPGPGEVSLRFFTVTGELPACGHGTVAALAVLAERAGTREYEAVLRAGGRTFTGRATGGAGRFEAAFDPGPISLRAGPAAAREAVLSALGLDPAAAGETCVASAGRARMLVPVRDRAVLAGLAPDLTLLRAACDRYGLLGCYVHTTPSPGGHAAARMFAPSIGVAEDIANANGTACLAARLAGRDGIALRVDMGDSLGAPATVTASARPGPNGPVVSVGGTATVTRALG